MMMGYEDMVVEIVVASMVMIRVKKSTSPEWRERDTSDPKTLAFDDDDALVYEKLCASEIVFFHV
jgi:hypothetical protein